MSNTIFLNPYIALALVSFLINIPCGYWRENHPKFSFKWFLWIHASIPVIVYLRLYWHTAKISIPICIFLAVVGQIVGSRYRRKTMTEEEKNRLAQVPAIDWPKQRNDAIKDEDVMIVLLNMGGPRTNADVKAFLKRVFSDSILMRMPFAKILQPIFAALIVNRRAKVTEERYQLIGGGSPLFDSTQKQAESLRKELRRRERSFDVTFSFNYSEPLPADTIKELKEKGKKYLFPLSLYPHYSLATTGSNIFYLKKEAKEKYPELQFLDPPTYYLHPKYIQAFAQRIREAVPTGETLDAYYLLFSAHGLPLYFLTEGDPYPFQIAQTTAAVLTKLNRQHGWNLCYQSAVGPLQWLKPSTDDMILTLAKKGIRKLMVVPIAFVTDHIETICEIDIEYRKLAQDLGITDFRMSKALETHPAFIEALADSVEDSFPEGRKKMDFFRTTALGQLIERAAQVINVKRN